MGRAATLVAVAALLACSQLQPALCQGGAATAAPAEPAPSSQVIISELMTNNKGAVKDGDGDTPDWVELSNVGSTPISLEGYKLTDERDGSDIWAFPAVTLAPGDHLMVFLDGKNLTDPAKPLHADFKLSKDHDYLALLTPTGGIASTVRYPAMPPDVSFGALGTEGVVAAQQERPSLSYALLASPTPGAANSGPRPGGPLILSTTRSPTPRPSGSGSGPIGVSTKVQQQQNPVAAVTLVYTVGYGPETAVSMTGYTDGTFRAEIPAAVVTPGALIRWFIQATDSTGVVTRDPPFADPGDRQYYGTIVADPTDSSTLFVLEIYCPLSNAPVNETATPGCSLFINDTFYDNVSVSRRGVTSLQWPKPKVKIESKQGSIFKVLKDWHTVSELNLNGEWTEPGENTFMREPLVWKTFSEAGVESMKSLNMHVRLNGKYYGKFAFGEQLDKDSLKGWGYNVDNVGPLWKSTSGEFSNLRWDVPPEHIQYYWKKYTRKKVNDDQSLLDFARGLSGGGSVVRSKYLFDAVNLPQVVNHMAAQTMILNQDRCTKNFYIYLDPTSQQWSMFPWDVESGFGIDRGLGGQPAPDYCILACEQWNSPLYCDRNHPQDLAVKTPWGLISAQYPTYFTGRRLQAAGGGCSAAAGAGSSDLLQHAARKLMQAGAAGRPAAASAGSVPLLEGRDAGAPANGAASDGLALPSNSTIAVADVDKDFTKEGPTATGSLGTYNYLIDAILAVPRTRQMYMRRLRSLMDQFIATGRLVAIVTDMHNEIRNEAKRDVAKWNNPGDPDRGFQQLITEQLPIRKDQLYNTYGPKGSIPLIPDAQPANPPLQMGRVESSGTGSFVEVVNPNPFAVDISGYSLGGAVQFRFRAGTVIPAKDSVFVAADIIGFKARAASPTAGEGRFVMGPFQGVLMGPAASVTLRNGKGATVATT